VTEKPTLCVLGGTGFVGTELVRRFALQGYWVRVPTRALADGDHLRVLDTVTLIRADVHDPRTLARLFAGVDVIINLIGVLNEHGHATFKQVHVDLAAKIVSAARTARVRRLLHMSSLGADAAAAPSRYLRSKGKAEARVREGAAALDYTIFRPSVIFGAGDSLTNRFARLLRLAGGFLPLARAGARFAPVSVQDVGEAFGRALRDRGTVGQTYELCGPDVISLEQLVRVTAGAAGLPCRIFRLPDFISRIQGLVMGCLPGKPFSLDNFRSLTVDSVCREDGCARLGIQPRHLLAELPAYLGDESAQAQLDLYRRINDR
jgi:uncharacterized protein YbjT (DUF2867 family)